eukprot:gene11018-13032_t
MELASLNASALAQLEATITGALAAAAGTSTEMVTIVQLASRGNSTVLVQSLVHAPTEAAAAAVVQLLVNGSSITSTLVQGPTAATGVTVFPKMLHPPPVSPPPPPSPPLTPPFPPWPPLITSVYDDTDVRATFNEHVSALMLICGMRWKGLGVVFFLWVAAAVLYFVSNTDIEMGSNKSVRMRGGAAGLGGGSPMSPTVSVAGTLAVPLLMFETAVLFVLRWTPAQEGSGIDPRDKLLVLDGMRVLGAVHIVAFHLYQEVEMSDGTVYRSSFCGFGKYWIPFFFLLSGFVLSLSNERSAHSGTLGNAGAVAEPFLAGSDAARAWAVLKAACQHMSAAASHLNRRLSKVFPLHAVALLGAAVIHLVQDGQRAVGAEEAGGTLLLVHSWYEPYHWDLNGPSWFLSNMVLFWLAAPHWCSAAQRCSPGAAAAMAAGCWAASFAPHVACYHLHDLPLYKRWYGIYLHNFIEFHPLANWYGVACGVFMGRLRCDTQWWLLGLCRRWGISVLLCLILLFFCIATPPGFEMGTYELMIGKGPASLPVFGTLIYLAAISAQEDFLAGWFLAKLSAIAWIAWPLYITHVAAHPAVKALARLVTDGDTEISVFLMQPALILLVAGGSVKLLDMCARFRTFVRSDACTGWRLAGRSMPRNYNVKVVPLMTEEINTAHGPEFLVGMTLLSGAKNGKHEVELDDARERGARA